jgi:hypothetical protein
MDITQQIREHIARQALGPGGGRPDMGAKRFDSIPL